MTDNKNKYTQPWLPISKNEIEKLGWDYIDVILFSGDAYIDHPSMGTAVIGRILEANGYRVAIIPQPNWQDDLRDFKKLGKPRLFFGISAGAMDSMVNHYTASRRKRNDDAYTPNARAGARPDYPTIVYSKILKEIFPDTPIVIGGIEASLRRLSHYDYWKDKLMPSILIDSAADILVYGMGEKPIIEIANRLASGESAENITDIPQTAIRQKVSQMPDERESNHHKILHSFEECNKNRTLQSSNFKDIEIESNKWESRTLWQRTGNVAIKVNGTYPPLTQNEIDSYYALPYTRLPHPKYRGKRIPAYEMIRHSITLHRGCFGGCAFCTISAHQGKFISSRSKESILQEAKKIMQMDDFKGYISDLGGPSANMYEMHGKDLSICKKCQRPSCLHPLPCKNLNNDHSKILDIYNSVDKIDGIKKTFIGSGVRYDLALHDSGNEEINKTNRKYIRNLIEHHVSGRLKVAPEHTSDEVLKYMRKPSFKLFGEFKKIFDDVNRNAGLNQQLIPYFISSHPGCTESEMAELACITKDLDFHLEQVQDFTPTPMTVSTEIYYSGVHPYTLKDVYCARSKDEKLAQRKYFFWYLPENRTDIIHSLKRIKREDLIYRLYPNNNYIFRSNKEFKGEKNHKNVKPVHNGDKAFNKKKRTKYNK